MSTASDHLDPMICAAVRASQYRTSDWFSRKTSTKPLNTRMPCARSGTDEGTWRSNLAARGVLGRTLVQQ
eukprot:6195831-Pleurochrysis_carterae.AAC.1